MAGYREFHYEKTYAKPDYSGFLDGAAQAVSSLFQSIGRQQTEKKKAADQFSYDLDEGQFENDQKILNELATNVVSRGRQEMLDQGRISSETSALMVQGKSHQQMSKIQMEKSKGLRAEILSRDSKDPYYDGQIDLDKLKIASNGEKNDIDFRHRGDRLANFEKEIGGVDAFKYDTYRADYIKRLGDMSREKTTGNPNSASTHYDQATFWDNKSGKPGVTDQHAIEYIKSDPQGRVDALFTKRLDTTLNEEIDRMIASGDTRVSWMKGKPKEEIKNELINDPSRNIINSQDYGVRKRELAKSDLQAADRINSKVSVEYKANKDSNNGGLYKNENLVHSYSFNNSKVIAGVPGSGDLSPNFNPGPGGVLFQKNGKPLQFNSTNPIRTNVNTGITSKAKIGSVPFNMTGYQLQAFKSTGAPFTFQGSNTDEVVDYVNKIPFENFDPEGKFKLEPELSVALQGYTVNQANILNAANNQEQTLQEQIAQAQNDNDEDKVAVLERNLMKIQGVKSLIGSGIDDQELALASSRAGIKGVQVNELVKASDTDLGNIKAISQGLDLKNKEYWNDDMRKVSDAYSVRAKEAAMAGFKSSVPVAPVKKTTKKASSSITPDDFNSKWSALKSGQSLTGPDGKNYTKK